MSTLLTILLAPVAFVGGLVLLVLVIYFLVILLLETLWKLLCKCLGMRP